MRGFPWIEKSPDRWNERWVGEWGRPVLVFALVGALAELMTVNVRLNLGLPGHRALFWMVPLIVVRLGYPFGLGAMVGSLSAAITALMVGGQLAGGAAYLPLVGVAGICLDGVIRFAEKRKCGFLALFFLVGLGGMVANLLCYTKRILDPLIHPGLFPGRIQGFAFFTYALFGLMAGFAGVILFRVVFQKRGEGNHP